jgi:pimeloyl-ACP methyl ester carboxylesterase
VQRALKALSHSRFFAGLAERALIGFIKQVHRYFAEPQLRAQVIERVAREIGPDTRLVVGHSLGSVVAYETLCAHPDWPVRALVTLGSPLGIRNLIFDRLQPAPVGEVGSWPGGVVAWTNVADRGDLVALVKELRPQFGQRVQDLRVDNGAKAHDVRPYLTAKETGHALAAFVGD